MMDKLLLDDALIFVVMDTEDERKVAVEANHQLVVFADDFHTLKLQVWMKVNAHYQGNFTGTIRLREFRDTVIDAGIPIG